MTQHNIKKLIAEKNKLDLQIKREKEQQRKDRTRRLIRKGALLEKYFNIEELTVEETEIFLKELLEKIKRS
ncbi:hypothetical protein FEZ48_07835 [Marinilactibacillus psychrotolerans]|uniref:DUF3847 domain-containing protein n=2 Tax=Marinilactibacillus psychrotolerans TaxID=191770 RepID=A0A5R9C2T2_9LACT|nr:hypothetical protein FEZ48_07835 [Marinilactibacillus psychrotolerans]